MINLYSKTETVFTKNGEATLVPTECRKIYAINGPWQLEMVLPLDPEGRYKLIDVDKIIKITGQDAVNEQTSAYQLFRIYDYRKEHEAVYVYACPIGLDARFDTFVASLTINDKTAAGAISDINGISNKYTVTTDISSQTKHGMAWANANMISILNGDESFVNAWGGEICYDNYNIKVNNRLGRATGAPEIRYGKNILGMSVEEDLSNAITRLYPVAESGEALNGITEYGVSIGGSITPYVDASNAGDYATPHISSCVAPYSLTKTTDDGSPTYIRTQGFYDLVRDYTATWFYDALKGINTGGVNGILKDIDLGWYVDNYDYTMINDGTMGLVEYFWRKVYDATGYVIRSGTIKSLIYDAMKAGFENVLINESSTYIGTSNRKLIHVADMSVNKYFYSYDWDTAGDYRVNVLSEADYCWVYYNNKWNQLDNDGITTGVTDTSTWKWYKVSGKKWKRYGNKKKKRYLRSQWWKISGVWYWFDDEGHGESDSDLMDTVLTWTEGMRVSNKTLVQKLAPSCKSCEEDMFKSLYNELISYCNTLYETDRLSYPAPIINIDVVDLSKTTEYKGFEGLLNIKLGDTVNCINTKLGISTELRITGVTYDVLRGYNSQLTIGLTENTIIQLLDSIGKPTGLEGKDYRAGEGIIIENGVISATPQEGKIKDVTVGGQSVVFGGKAIIDLDEINGMGLQWFEETEDSLYGAVDQIKLVDDATYKVGSGTSATLYGYRDGSAIGDTITVTVDANDDALMMYYPQTYTSRSAYISSVSGDGSTSTTSGFLPNCGYILILAKDTTNVSIHWSDVGASSPNLNCAYADFNLNTVPLNERYKPDTYRPQATGGGMAGYGCYVYKTSVTVDGDTWYACMISKEIAVEQNAVDVRTSFRSLIDYLPLADYPTGQAYPGTTYNVAYTNLHDAIEAVIPLAKDISSGNYSGLSREGKLAFYAGGDDEHGTNAPIKIYRDGTYEGFDMVGATSSANGKKGVVPAPTISERNKFLRGDGTWQTAGGVEDVKSDGTTTVVNNVAHINTMTGATAQNNGKKGLVPAPTIANKDKFLKGDGTWDTPADTTYNDFAGSAHGLVPGVSTQAGKYLKDDGSWDSPQGTTVVANPSGTATADLTKLQVGEDIYGVSSGTTVVANPSGTPTANLNTIQVENTIYSIPSGGGSFIEVVTDILKYQDWDFAYDNPDGLVAFISTNMYFAGGGVHYTENDRVMAVYKIEIPSTARKIRYTLHQQGSFASDLTQDMYKFCIGVKSTYDDVNIATPDDNDWLVKQTQDYVGMNTTIEDELILDSVIADSYLYIMSNGYACNLSKIEMVEGGCNLEDLTDVDITNPQNNNVLKYNSTSQKWENSAGGGGGGDTVTITPMFNKGLKLATFSINGVSGDIYYPMSRITSVNMTNVKNPTYMIDSDTDYFTIAPASGYEGITYRIEHTFEVGHNYKISFDFTNVATSGFQNYPWRCAVESSLVTNYNVAVGTSNLPKTATTQTVELTFTASATVMYLVFYLASLTASGNWQESIENVTIEEVTS